MTWPCPYAWLALMSTLAILTSLVLAWGAWDTKKILERMDRQAEACSRDLKDRMDGDTEAQP